MLKSLALILVLSLVCAGLLLLDQPAVHASMIGGLSSFETITREQADAMPEPSGTIMLTLDGVQLPYDPASNTYFIPQSPDTAHFEGRLQLEMAPGYTYSVFPGAEVSKQQALENSTGYRIFGLNGDACVSSKLIFTALPVICLRTQDGELPGDEAQVGTLALFEVRDGKLRVQQSRMNINLRGNTSRRFPKKSYRVTLMHEDGENRSLALAGLRSDDDWILNPMYSDKSKIREWLVEEGDEVTTSDGVVRYENGTVVKAPMAGTISDLYLEEGDDFMPGTALFRVADYANPLINFNVDEYDVSALSKGMKVTVKVLSTGKELDAEITRVAQEATVMGDLAFYPVRLELPQDGTLPMGVTCEIIIPRESAKKVTTVSLSAIQYDEDGKPFVYCYDRNDEIVEQSVVLGINDGHIVEVKEGIRSGETILVPPSFSFDPAAMREQMMGGGR